MPVALAVTVLTSDDSAPPHIVPNRVRVAVEGGCGGLILAAADLQTARELAPRLARVVPGIRLPGDPIARPGPVGHARRRRRPAAPTCW